MARVGRNGLSHRLQQLAVRVKHDCIWRPIKAILMELLVWLVGKLMYLVVAGARGIEALLLCLRGLENQVDWRRGVILLSTKEFHVDFLGVVEVLQTMSAVKLIQMVLWPTQKKAPHVPLVAVIFMPARKLPYKMSVLVVVISAMGIKPPLPGSPPLTIN